MIHLNIQEQPFGGSVSTMITSFSWLIMFVDRGCKLAIAQLLVLFRELNEHLGKNRQTGETLRLSCFLLDGDTMY